MKTSVILIILLVFNTTALIAGPIAQFSKGISSWFFVIIEAILLIGYYINTIIKELREAEKVDFDNITLYVTKATRKKNHFRNLTH